MKVSLVSPSVRSRYTMSLAWLLAQDGHEVASIVVRRMLGLSRIRQEWGMGPSRLVRKVLRKGLRLEATEAKVNPEGMVAFCRRVGVPTGDVNDVARRLGCAVVFCDDLNAPDAVAHLKAVAPELVFFTGGGMIRRALLESAGQGVVNCHMGPLPAFRGMDVVEWPAYLGEPLGITCHFMDEGLDTGPILLREPVVVRPGDAFLDVRARMEPQMVEAMRRVAALAARGELRREAQGVWDGKQYFMMHPRLKVLAGERLLARRT